MSKISNLIAKETVIDVEFPDIDGFVVKLVYLGRDDLIKIRNASLGYKFNKRTRQREEEVDNAPPHDKVSQVLQNSNRHRSHKKHRS